MIHTIDINFRGVEKSIACYVMETTEGPILFECGPHSTYDNLCAGLKDIGIQVSDLKALFLSHVHFDHAGAAWALAKEGVDVYIHINGHKHLANPEKLYNSAKRIYKDMMEPLWGKMEKISLDKLHMVLDGQQFTYGDKTITAWYTPGHAVHHLAYQVDKLLFAGDVCGVKIGKRPVVPPCPPPDINIELWKDSLAKIDSLDIDTAYLTHFGSTSNVKAHNQELSDVLDSYATWMLPHYEAQRPLEEITPEFTKFAVADLVSRGLPKEEVIAYETANPSYMAVAGLMRYWKKRKEREAAAKA